MAYYQIGQFYGLMESLALWAALGMLWFLYRYVNEKKTGAFLAANVCTLWSASFTSGIWCCCLVLLNGDPRLWKRSGNEDCGSGTGEKSEPERAAEPGRSRGRGQSRGAQDKKDAAARAEAADTESSFRLPGILLILLPIVVLE